MEINWKLLAEVKKRTLLGKGSVLPVDLFIEYKDIGLVEGVSSSARLSQGGFRMFDEEKENSKKKQKKEKARPKYFSSSY